MKFLFDLDYTLLDTEKFKKALIAAIVFVGGPSVEDCESAFSVVTEKMGMFDADSFFHELKDTFFSDQAAIEARVAFDRVLTETAQYLYPEAKELLEALRKHDGAVVDLMTFGNAAWQRAKVEHSGLAELFDETIYTEKDKGERLRDAGRGQDLVIVVNDNGEEIQRMIAVAPEYTYILKKGPKPVPAEVVFLPTASTMQELALQLGEQTGWDLLREIQEIRENQERESKLSRK